MLVLTFRTNDRIFLDTADGRIEVVFVKAQYKGKMRIGFQAPDSVHIIRENAGNKERRES